MPQQRCITLRSRCYERYIYVMASCILLRLIWMAFALHTFESRFLDGFFYAITVWWKVSKSTIISQTWRNSTITKTKEKLKVLKVSDLTKKLNFKSEMKPIGEVVVVVPINVFYCCSYQMRFTLIWIILFLISKWCPSSKSRVIVSSLVNGCIVVISMCSYYQGKIIGF